MTPTVLLVRPTAEELALLSGPGREYDVRTSDVEELPEALLADVDAVVLGSSVRDPVPVVQTVHRVLPLAGVVVLTDEATGGEVRRALSYAPAVPASLVVAGRAQPDLAVTVAELARSAVRGRHHDALVSAVATRRGDRAERPVVPAGLGALLAHAPFGVLVGSLHGELLSWNSRAEDLLRVGGVRPGHAIPRLFLESGQLEQVFTRAAAGSASEGVHAAPLDARTGTLLEVSAVPTRLEDGRDAVLVLLQDVTSQRDAERRRDRLAAQVQLLVHVTESLSGTLEPDETLRRLAAEVVPTLCDLVSLQLDDVRGQTVRVAMHHREAALEELAATTGEIMPEAVSDELPSRRIASGESFVLIPEFTDADLERMVAHPDARALLRRMDLRSVMAVPLPGRDRVLGSMSMANTSASPAFTSDDVAVALEVGRRAGLALQTAELYARQRELAVELQRSMLTDPPEPDHSEIVVRYVTAAREAQVGGDWYDAFLQADGATVLVIGDVVGHDTRSAAAMGQVRGLLRGIGYTTGAGPAEILRRVDEAMEGLMVNTTASVVVARIEQPQSWTEDGIARVRWSNAGHPPPVVLPGGGSAALLAEDDPDLLLGVMPDVDRHESEALLGRGSTLVFYTDGLVERRDQPVEEGIVRLLAAVDRLGHLPLQELCDRLIAELLPPEAEDDVALVAVRLHRQDQPRPADAGPEVIPPNVPPPPGR